MRILYQVIRQVIRHMSLLVKTIIGKRMIRQMVLRITLIADLTTRIMTLQNRV